MKKINWRMLVIFSIATLLFAVAYSQSPLYTSNQYQYFLHGLARAGVGYLSEDWLANTSDPTPLFSWLVEVTTRVQAPYLFHFYYLLIMGVYLVSITGIVVLVFPQIKKNRNLLPFLGGLVIIHSAGLRYVLSDILGVEWGYILEGGVAGQRLLGAVFQPSVFGVFLILSIFMYSQRKIVPAILSATFAASVHPTFLLSSAILIGVYIFELIFLERRWRQAIGMGLLALATVAPILIYTFVHFTGGPPEIAQKARDILVNIRIPHHARIDNWFNLTVFVQLGFIVLSLYLLRKNQLLFLMSFPLGIAILLTIIHYYSGNLFIALLFPWRISTWLIPVAVGLLLAQGILWLSGAVSIFWRKFLLILGATFLFLALLSGIVRTYAEFKQASLSPTLSVEHFVAEHRRSGDIYLIPVKMYNFRLNAGVAVYDDFFSIPYRYGDVVAWYARFLQGKYFYEMAECERLYELKDKGVTHVILPVDFPADCQVLECLYADEVYGVYKVNSE